MRKETNRMAKIDELLKEEISKIISYELNNPNLTGMISVTKVHTTPDFRYAKVYISIYGAKSPAKAMKALNDSKGYIRSLLAKNINIRTTPQIVFEKDTSMEYGDHMEQLINKVIEEDKKFKRE